MMNLLQNYSAMPFNILVVIKRKLGIETQLNWFAYFENAPWLDQRALRRLRIFPAPYAGHVHQFRTTDIDQVLFETTWHFYSSCNVIFWIQAYLVLIADDL